MKFNIEVDTRTLVPILLVLFLMVYGAANAQTVLRSERQFDPALDRHIEFGFGVVDEHFDHIPEARREAIKAMLELNRQRLISAGKLSATPPKTITNFGWPMRSAAGRTNNDYFVINNFVDQNALPVAITDYNCTQRTYDGHKGIDVGSSPAPWKMMDDQDVVITAGAPGVITSRQDGNADRSCAALETNGDWNAVYVSHADGSVAWYGHLKKDSLTPKQVGDTVVAGEYLGIMGSSGFSTGPHLHLELYDAAGALVDPFKGACNQKSAQVTWQRQRPFREPTVFALLVSNGQGSSPTCQPNGTVIGAENLAATDFITPGSTAYFTVFLRDQTPGNPVQIRLLRPDGSVYSTKTSDDTTATSVFWFWNYPDFPNVPGTWTFEATFATRAYTRAFQVGGGPAFGAPAQLNVLANSEQSGVAGATFPNPIRLHVLDAQGKAVPGARVNFAAPAGTGATVVLESFTALTDNSGTASVAGIANAKAGTYALSASVAGVATPASIALTNLPATTALTRAPASVDFGTQSMKTTSPATAVTLSNNNGAPLTVSNIVASAHFGVTHNCAALAAGASCVANVTFTPDIEGTAPGSLTITTSAGSDAVLLTGVGERSLVDHYYRSILRRAADAGGKTYWDGEAVRVRALGVSVNEVWYALAGQFFGSAEYANQNRDDTGYVTDLYNTFFNRAPDSGGLAYWTGQLSQGMPREVVLTGFMFSQEFGSFMQGIFGTPGTRKELDTLVDFYRGLLARLPDEGGFKYWLGQFRTAQCAGGAAVNAQAELISSLYATGGEYAGRNRSNAQYVGDLYNAFLRRGGDLGGVQYWIGQIATGARTRENVRQQFVASPEFSARVAAIIAQGCAS